MLELEQAILMGFGPSREERGKAKRPAGPAEKQAQAMGDVRRGGNARLPAHVGERKRETGRGPGWASRPSAK